MKKLTIITAMLILSLTVGCGKKADPEFPEDTPAPTIDAQISEQTTGEEQELPEADILDKELEEKIKDVNKEAAVTGSTNPGAKMINIKLPLEKKDSASKDFINQVSKIMKISKLKESDYEYLSFIAVSGSENILSASFNKAENGYELDKLLAVDKSFEDSLKAEAKKNSLFK